MEKGNSAASKKYWREEDIQFLTDIKPYCDPSVTLPDREMLKPSQKGTPTTFKPTVQRGNGSNNPSRIKVIFPHLAWTDMR